MWDDDTTLKLPTNNEIDKRERRSLRVAPSLFKMRDLEQTYYVGDMNLIASSR